MYEILFIRQKKNIVPLINQENKEKKRKDNYNYFNNKKKNKDNWKQNNK